MRLLDINTHFQYRERIEAFALALLDCRELAAGENGEDFRHDDRQHVGRQQVAQADMTLTAGVDIGQEAGRAILVAVDPRDVLADWGPFARRVRAGIDPDRAHPDPAGIMRSTGVIAD